MFMITETKYTVPLDIIEEARQGVYTESKSILNKPTGRFFYDPWVIKDEYKNTVWEKILNTLPNNVGEARVINLGYGKTYQSHSDIDDRYHLNISGNQSYLIDLDNLDMHATVVDGRWYEMDAGRLHAATNYGEIDRLQLVVRKLLKINPLEEFNHVTITCVEEHLARFNFDKHISPWLNKQNKNGKINNFLYKDTIVEFDCDATTSSEIAKIIPKQFKLEIK